MRSKTKFNKKRFNSRKRINKNVRKGSRKRIHGGSNKSLIKLKRRKVNSRKQRGGRCLNKDKNCLRLAILIGKYIPNWTVNPPGHSKYEKKASLQTQFIDKLDKLLTSWINTLENLMINNNTKDLAIQIYNFVDIVANDIDIMNKCGGKKLKYNRDEKCKKETDDNIIIGHIKTLVHPIQATESRAATADEVVVNIKKALGIFDPIYFELESNGPTYASPYVAGASMAFGALQPNPDEQSASNGDGEISEVPTYEAVPDAKVAAAAKAAAAKADAATYQAVPIAKDEIVFVPEMRGAEIFSPGIVS